MNELLKLSDFHLSTLPRQVLRPNYDRKQLSAGIVHIGLGNFHRAHQAWYLHRLMQQGKAYDWAIIGAGVRAYDIDMREKLLQQDCLTTLVSLDPAGTSVEVIGSMIDYLPIEEGQVSLIAQMADPKIRIVSLTVTEGGYYTHPQSGEFDAAHQDIVHDVAHPDRPKTAFGAMVAALKLRRAAGHAPFTAQSCDNLHDNGAILRQVIVSLAKLSDPDLADWIDENGAFPNSMVDCIVPATGAKELACVREKGVDDSAPVTHENFRQWVIEDQFCASRPEWEAVGAILTDNIAGYEAMKIRVLNGGHQVLANVGEILGIATISACMQDDGVAEFFQKVESEEILPYVDSVPNMTPQEYLALITQRFSNPIIQDTTRRVAFDGSARHRSFVLPILHDALNAEGKIEGLALVQALWARMCAGTREDGSAIEPNDPYWDELHRTARVARHDPEAWLQQPFYDGLRDSEVFTHAFSDWLRRLWSNGCRKTLEEYLGGKL